MPFDADALRNSTRQDDAPPDGSYDVELIDGAIITANADGRQWAKLTWRALAGPHRDVEWSSWHSIDAYDRQGNPSQALQITGRNLTAMGISLEDVHDEDDLADALREREHKSFAVDVKRNGAFTNTDVSRQLDYVSQSLPGVGSGRATNSTTASNAGNAIDPDVVQPGLGSQMQQPIKRDVERVENPPPDIPVEPYPPQQPTPAKGDIDPVTGEPFPF